LALIYPSDREARPAACSQYIAYTEPMAPTSQSTWQLIGQLSTIGMSFVFAIVLGFGAGFWLDAVLGTKPWLSFVGFFFGVAAGMLNVYRVLQLSNRK
jgi:F0F1-type ATP synthase assembly protein I